MTLLQLEDLMLSWLDDPYASYYTRPQMKVWLNNAQKEVQRRLLKAGENYYDTLVQTNTIVNQAAYSLPSDFHNVSKFELVTSGSGTPNENRALLTPVTLVQLNQVGSGPGQPTCYTLRQDCLVLAPTPSNIWPLKLTYAYLVQDMSLDTDVPNVPSQYHELIAILATFDAYLKDKTDPIDFLKNKRDEYLKSIEQDAKDRKRDAPRMVVTTTDYGFYGNF